MGVSTPHAPRRGGCTVRRCCCATGLAVLAVAVLEGVYMGAGLAQCFVPVRDVEVVDTATLVRRITEAAATAPPSNSSSSSSSSSGGPLCVHQTWKSTDLSGLAYNSVPAWNRTFACHVLHTDAALRALVADPGVPRAQRRAYAAYASNVQRADVARVALLHRAGGLYADLDAFPRPPCTALAHTLAAAPHALRTAVVPRGGGGVATNHVLLAPAHSAFLAHVLARLPAQQRRWRAVPLPYLRVFLTTGPCALTAALRSWARAARARGVVPAPGVVVLADPQNLVAHYAGRTWLGPDGRALNWIGDNPRLAAQYAAVLLVAVAAVVAFALLRRCTRRNGRCRGRGRSRRPECARDSGIPPNRVSSDDEGDDEGDDEELSEVVSK